MNAKPEIVIETIEIKEAIIDMFAAYAMYAPTDKVIIPPIPAWVNV